MHHKHSAAWKAVRQRMGYYSFTTDLTDRTDECPVSIKQIKKFVAFPGLTPLQPDAYGHPCKQASLSDPPHLSGLPCWQTGKPSKQNSCPWQYKMSLLRGYGRLPQTFNNGICSLPYRILPSDICGFILILCP